MPHFRRPVDENESDEHTLKVRNSSDVPANLSVNSAISSPSKHLVDDRREEEEKENTENGTNIVAMKKGAFGEINSCVFHNSILFNRYSSYSVDTLVIFHGKDAVFPMLSILFKST